MSEKQVKVTRYVRTVLDGKLVVRRPGDRVPVEEAARLGLEIPVELSPRHFRGARLPEGWR